jgi:hypothetical protein
MYFLDHLATFTQPGSVEDLLAAFMVLSFVHSLFIYFFIVIYDLRFIFMYCLVFSLSFYLFAGGARAGPSLPCAAGASGAGISLRSKPGSIETMHASLL